MAEKKFRNIVTAEQLQEVTAGQLKAQPEPEPESDPVMSFTLRMRRSLVAKVDQAAAARPGSVSRNTWIVEAVSKALHSGSKVEP